MKFPRYWARTRESKDSPVCCWRWSDVSKEDAQQKADAAGFDLSRRRASGEKMASYGYGQGAMREEIIQTLPAPAGSPAAAVVTRNIYGALVLNAAGVMFIDVDFPYVPANIFAAIGRLFSKSKPAPDPQAVAIEQLQTWSRQQPDLGLRIYRTSAGLRCLVTNRTFDPADEATLGLLRSAGSDPLYIRLCQSQACFRARLTPKPWRCGVKTPPSRFPWETPEKEAKYRKWQAKYEQAAGAFAVCKLLQQLGPADVNPAVAPILSLHDQLACVAADRPLA